MRIIVQNRWILVQKDAKLNKFNIFAMIVL